MHSIINVGKPTPRISLPDWYGKTWELRQTSETRQQDSFNFRNESQLLRSESSIAANWENRKTNNQLTERHQEVNRWKDDFEFLVEALNEEIATLQHEKSLTEETLNFFAQNFAILNECLSQRDKRNGADLCTDDAEIEIKKEVALLESLKSVLTCKSLNAWEQLNRLEEVKLKAEEDLNDKRTTLRIDESCLENDRNSSNISFKQDPSRLPSQVISYESWLENCQYLKKCIENELETSLRLRDDICVPRDRAMNDIRAQNDMTNFCLRRRIHETKRLKTELEWQKENLKKSLERLHNEIYNLEDAVQDKTNALKLAESRCEARLLRPGNENVRDDALVGLHREVVSLHSITNDLSDKLDNAKSTYNCIENHLVTIDRELHYKTQSLCADVHCLDIRARLKFNPGGPPDTETDRNMELTNTENAKKFKECY